MKRIIINAVEIDTSFKFGHNKLFKPYKYPYY